MKNGMKTRAELHKTSSFLRSLKTRNTRSSQLRRDRRMHTSAPNSTKVGAGKQVHAIRNVAMGAFKHRKNHRRHEKIGLVNA